MYKISKLTALAAAGTLIISILNGCAGTTGLTGPAPTPVPTNAAELAGYVATAVSEVTSMEYDTTVDMQAVMSMGDLFGEGEEESEDISTPMNVKVDMKAQATSDPVIAHAEGTVDVDVFDEVNSQQVETYATEEDGKYVVYSKDAEDTWTKTESDKSELDDIYNLSMYEAIRDGQIEATMETVPDESGIADESNVAGESGSPAAYRMDIVLTGDEIMDYVGSAFDSLESVFGEDYDAALADASVRITLYVDAETNLPARMEFDGTEIGNKIMSYVQSFISVTVNSFTVSSEYSKYNEIPEITIPEDVAANAVLTENTDDLTGSEDAETEEFTLPEVGEDGKYRVYSSAMGTTAAFTIPDGQIASDGQSDVLFTINEDGMLPYSQYIFCFIDELTEEDLEAIATETEWVGDVDPEAVSESYVGDKTVIDVNGMQVSYVLKSCMLNAGTDTQSYSAEINGWTVLDGTSFVVSFDYYDESDSSSDDGIDYEELIRSAFESVTFE